MVLSIQKSEIIVLLKSGEGITIAAVELAQRGQLTILKSLRDRYDLKQGHKMTVVDIGGVFLVSPRQIRVDAHADALRDGLLAAGVTLEDMLVELRRRREADGAE